ncbi:MAG: L-histidine N(alpha)-methyltransferase, partial [Luminiphilus sp.]|nr:L-histidine N(alpha)-methyltransferase [Luminiphilus sp.]
MTLKFNLAGNSPPNLRFIETKRPVIDETHEVLASLAQNPPRLSPKYFYDSRGSELFEHITGLPEYYLTRSEAEIFDLYLDEIAEALGSGDIIIEPGSGNCSKVQPLLERATPNAFVP